MKEHPDNIHSDFFEIFNIQKFDPDLLDYNLLKYHIPLRYAHDKGLFEG
jgi:hypothetical protein